MVRQRQSWDCAIAALSSLLGVSYEEVLAAAARVAACERGLYLEEIMDTAGELGVMLKKRSPGRYNVTTDTGILRVYNHDLKGNGAHVVVLWEGRVLNPHGYVAHAAEYAEELARKKWKLGTLLIEEPR